MIRPLADRERRRQVDIEHPFEIGSGNPLQRRTVAHADIMDEDVEPPRSPRDAVEREVHRRLVGDIERYRLGRPALLRDPRHDGGAAFRAAAVHQHMRPGASEAQRDLQAEPLRRAGDVSR
jgi:hypothetical protein